MSQIGPDGKNYPDGYDTADGATVNNGIVTLANGQSYPFQGYNSAGEPQYNLSQPIPTGAAGGTAGQAGTSNAVAGAGDQVGTPDAAANGIVTSFASSIGAAKIPVIVGTTLLVLSLVALEVMTAGTGIFILAALLGLDLVTGGITNAVAGTEKWFHDTLGNLLGTFGKKYGGIIGDFAIVIAVGGVVYLIAHRSGQSTIRVQAVRANPAKIRKVKPLRIPI
jgi:hypothetical protein